jgi:hypothetical protein
MPSILVKRGTEAALLATNPVVASGELIYSTDTSKLKIGDGVSSYSGLPIVGSGIYAPLNGAIFTGQITAPNGSFTNQVSIASNTITSGIALNIINSSNLYLWSNFR